MSVELLDEIYTLLGEAGNLSACSYNLGWLDGEGLKKDCTGCTRQDYDKIVRKLNNSFHKLRKKIKKLLKKV